MTKHMLYRVNVYSNELPYIIVRCNVYDDPYITDNIEKKKKGALEYIMKVFMFLSQDEIDALPDVDKQRYMEDYKIYSVNHSAKYNLTHIHDKVVFKISKKRYKELKKLYETDVDIFFNMISDYEINAYFIKQDQVKQKKQEKLSAEELRLREWEKQVERLERIDNLKTRQHIVELHESARNQQGRLKDLPHQQDALEWWYSTDIGMIATMLTHLW